MDAMEARKKAFAIKIMIGPEDELDSKNEKIQKELGEEDSAPFLPEVDEEKEGHEQMEEALAGMAGKPGSLREGVRMEMMKKKGLSNKEQNSSIHKTLSQGEKTLCH